MEDEPKKGEVVKFPAPEGSMTANLETEFTKWLEKYAPTVETGSDEAFQKLSLQFAETLALSQNDPKMKLILDYMALEFSRRRSEWNDKAQAADIEELGEGYAAVALRYAELTSIINRVDVRRT